MVSGKIVVAAVQMQSTADVGKNLAMAVKHVDAAANAGAQFIGLPENYGFLGDRTVMITEARPLDDHPYLSPMVDIARRRGVYVLAGSVPEVGPDDQHVYNTSTLIGPTGQRLASYRKIHLFDATLSEGQSLCESDHVTAGADVIAVDLPPFKLGMTICYDLRFPELYRALVDQGVSLITIPAAFTLHTGKDHWEPLLRARAIESQSYVIAPAQWGGHGGGRYSWGKTTVIDPWGTTLAIASEGDGYIMAQIDMAFLERVRSDVPSLRHRRLK
ncbi:MAG: carbon-nitrogen hydrolase family protein [Clostridia bacterium]|nr:carbon-nitrogen hydrolase family protein [Deltaproteobacteria bacterium]